MKIYLISNVPSGGDEIEEVLDNANVSVISKELLGSIKEIDDEVVRRISSSNANMLIFVTDDPIGAGMRLNKYDGISAATCNTVGDVSAARANGANVIILDNERAEKQEIAQALVKGGGGLGKMLQITSVPKKKQFVERPAVEKPIERRERPVEREKQQAPIYKEPSAPITINVKLPHMPQLFGGKKKVKDKQPEDEEPLPTGKPRPGLLGKIKDELGIVD
ncbi:MAG: RpiB/LacA/LacB family sugar-phosphate isomerase [Candidatus Micrarchaeota archaeon]|nr:RpiB/LacA/LacB family sugar-phosphate isomerase [Candidatus Micrarchaeota archaeon]